MTFPASILRTGTTACCSAALVIAAWVGAALAQQPAPQGVTIERTDLGNGAYMLVGNGGNIGLSVGEDGVLMIDDQFAPLTDKILASVAEVTDKPVTFVVNTHWHGDHTGGNENLGKAGALIVAHDNVHARMSTDQFVKAFNRTVPAAPADALPVITFSESTTFHFNGDTIRVIHAANGHTDGDAIIFMEKANVLHMGDNYFNNMFPFIDLSSGGSIDGMIAALEEGLALTGGDVQVIPGHGPLATRADMEEMRDILQEARDKVAAAIAADKSLDEIKADAPLAYLDDRWSGAFINAASFTETIYNSLTSADE